MGIKCPSCGYDNEDPGDGGPLSCNLCQYVLRREKTRQAEDPGLEFKKLAEDAVAQAAQDMLLAGYGIELDFSAASVSGLDACLTAMYGAAGESPDNDDYRLTPGKKAVVLRYGAYLGETLRRLSGGSWRRDPAAPADVTRASVVFRGGEVHPFLKVFLRLKNGKKESLFAALQKASAADVSMERAWGRGFMRQAQLTAARGALPWTERKTLVLQFCLSAAVLDPALKAEAEALSQKVLLAPDPDAQKAAPEPARQPPAQPSQPAQAPQAPAPTQQEHGLERRFESFGRHMVQNTSDYPILAGLGLDLDYSPGSLLAVDLAIDEAIGEKGEAPDADIETYKLSKEQVGDRLAFGAYYGEVCRRVLGGVWQRHPGLRPGTDKDTELLTAQIALAERTTQPVYQAILRFKNGVSEDFFRQLQELAAALGVPQKSWGTGLVKQAGLILDRGTLPLPRRAKMVGHLCKLALDFDPDLASEVLVLTQKLSKLQPRQPAQPQPAAAPDPTAQHTPDKKILQAAAQIFSAELALKNGLFDEAARLLGLALQLDPTDPKTWLLLCMAQYKLKKVPESVASIKRACELKPDYWDAWKLRSEIMSALQKFDEEALCWEQLVKLTPKDMVAWLYFAAASSKAGRAQEALDRVARAQELAPGDPETALLKATVLDRSGEKAAALRDAGALLADPARLTLLKKRPPQDYNYLLGAGLSPELTKLIQSALA